MQPEPQLSKAQVIARNSIWYGLELVCTIVGALLTSIMVARVLGPMRLSYFNYVVWLTNITAAVGGFGLHTTARKYMAEYLNRGDRSVARAMYLSTLKLQAWIAAAMTAVALALVFLFGDPRYHLISVLLSLNMAPRMLGYIPSQANNADEAMRRNTTPAMWGSALTISLTLFSLWIGWDLIGVAAAMTLGPVLETILKLRSVEQWLGDVSPAPIPLELKKRMRSYSGQGVVLMILNLVVWDRSDIVFLKALSPDPRQLTFFSTAFSLTERLMMLPNAFGGSVGATMMAQYGRGKEALRELTVNSARYAFLACVPLLAGMASISAPLVLIYGKDYQPMARVLAIVSLLAIPKAMMQAPTALLQSTEKQRHLIFWGCVGGAVDVTLDILLIPGYGAIGAAVANGIGQTVACLGVWGSAWRLSRLDLRLGDFARITLAGAVMSAGVLTVRRDVPGFSGMTLAILAGAVIWFICIRLLGILTVVDGGRLLAAGRAFPSAARPFWARAVNLLVPPAKEARMAAPLE